MTTTTQASARMVALKDLHPAKGTKYDVRKSGNGDITELKASIKSLGLLIPLVVKQDAGKLIVVGGNRRLAALREIYPDLTRQIPIVDADQIKGDTRVVAMATNIALPPHPIDRYEVIAALVNEGMEPAEAQERFGLSDKVFRQTMRLGQLAPIVIEAYRSGQMDGDTARAFALTDDQKAQEKLFKVLQKNHNGRFSAYAVSQKLGGSQTVGKLVTFLGVETVAAAGILKVEDLFGTSHDVTDEKKLGQMVEAKLNEKIQELLDDGWSWASKEEDIGGDRYYYGYEKSGSLKLTKEERERQAEIGKVMSNAAEDEEDWTAEEHALHAEHVAIDLAAKVRSYTKEQRARSGCILSIDYDGSLKIEYGRVKPAPAKKSVPLKGDAPAKKADAAPGEVAVISNKLAERMSTDLQEAVKVALESDPRLAAAALVAAFASGGRVLNVRVGSGSSGTDDDFARIFEGTKNASANELLSMLMKVAQQAVNIVTHSNLHVPLQSNAGLKALIGAMKPNVVNVAVSNAFDYDNYFNSISVAGIADAVRTAQGDAPGDSTAKMQKKNAVSFALQMVPPTNWLPKEMRTVHYDGPVEPETVKKTARSVAKKASADKPKAGSVKPAKKTVKKAAKKKAK